MEPEQILIIDDDEVALKNLARLLHQEGREVHSARSGREGLACLNKKRFDLVVTDVVIEDISGMEILDRVRAEFPGMEVIMVTGYASIPTAIESIRKGAFHYLEKPFRPEEVRHLVEQALERVRLRKRVQELEARLEGGPAEPVLIGQSRVIMETVKLLKQVAQADCNVLLTGESGTGKELAARMIHRQSQRQAGRFLAINCAGFSEELLANELFGHEKDAFTGATSTKAGLLESASGGTLFLDEVGDMPLSMQVKMLRALQEQEVIRVGGNRAIPIDVRIIAATNQELKKAVAAGLFRQDLYFRLNVVSIHIPPLRERKEDIPLLAHYFLNCSSGSGRRKLRGFSESAMKLLMEYSYPGNVRELENIVARAVALAQDETIQVRDLPPDLLELDTFSFALPQDQIRTLAELNRDYIQWVLTKCGRNKTRAAKLLGIDRSSLWRHLKRYEIED